MTAHVTPTRVYFTIFAALLMLTALTVEAATISFPLLYLIGRHP